MVRGRSVFGYVRDPVARGDEDNFYYKSLWQIAYSSVPITIARSIVNSLGGPPLKGGILFQYIVNELRQRNDYE